jgi:hypothetical protein
LRAERLAALAIALSLLAGAAGAKEPVSFLGFRLLNLEEQQVKWQSPMLGKGAVITYAFATRRIDTPGARNCAAMLPPAAAYQRSNIAASDFEAQAAAAFRMWEKAANVEFRLTDDVESAGIIIGAQAVPVGRAFTNVSLTAGSGDRKTIGRSLICLNPNQPWKIGFDGRLSVYDLRYTIAHEIGHAIGLDHPSAAGQLMSYRYDEKHAGLQKGDVDGAALLYGPRSNTERFANDTRPDQQPREPAAQEAPDRGWPFGIGAKRTGPPEPLQFPDATGSITPRP